MALRNSGTLLLDTQGLIIAEYRNYLNYKGQPGAGDAFLRWFFNNRGKPDLCKEVTITPVNHQWRQFEEFPNDEMLAKFDKADQKFVATAIAGLPEVDILQAADHKWLQWAPGLAVHQINVQFICEAELRATLDGKSRRQVE